MTRSSVQISFSDIFRLVLGGWRWILAGVLLGLAGGLTKIWLSEPVYRAQTVLAPISGDSGRDAVSRITGQLGLLSGMIGSLGLSSGSNRETNIATLRSRAVLERFVEREKLLPVLFAEQWDAQKADWKIVEGKPQQPTMDDAILLLDKSIRELKVDAQTGLVTLSINWRDRNLAAAWANSLVATANELIRSRVIEESRRNIEFLDAELKRTTVLERQQIIFRLIESRTSEVMMANGRPEYAFAVIDPATPPDPDKYAWPRRRLIALLGVLVGLCVGVFGVVGVEIIGRFRGRPAGQAG